MKIKQIALIIATLGTSAISMAAPVTQAEISAAKANNTIQQAWITGASAPTATVYEGWVRGCDANTNAIFSTTTSTSAVKPNTLGNFSAYACKRGGVVSVLYHTLDGGSLNAYAPHTIGTVLARVKFPGTGTTCGQAPQQYTDTNNALNNATVYKSCPLTGAAIPSSGPTTDTNSNNRTALGQDPDAPQWPLGGYSDVEAALFAPGIGGGRLVGRGTESNVGIGQAFGVAVSIPLYRAMQAAQGITETGTNNSDYDPANAPNLKSSQYASLITVGDILGNWSSIVPGNTTHKIKLFRRVDTSGTQASSNAFFLRSPCAGSASLTPARDQTTGLYVVKSESGTGGVKTGLSAASGNATAAEQFAIGVMSLENNWRDDGTSGLYRYVKIDGVHPEAGNVTKAFTTAVNGDYRFHMELKQFVRADYNSVPGSTTAPAAKTPFERDILGQITNQLRNPPSNTCSEFPRGLTLNPLGSGNGCPAIVAKVTNQGINCAAPQQILP